MRRPRRFAACSLLALVASAAVPGGRARAEETDGWSWLLRHAPGDDGAKVAPDVADCDVERLALWARSAVAVAIGLADEPPADGAADASGFLVSRDGLFVTTRDVLRRARASPAIGLWARPSAGPWTRAVPLGDSWCGDVGVARLVTARSDLRPVEFAAAWPASPPKRVVCVGSPFGRRAVATEGTLGTVEWCSPAAAGGRETLAPAASPRGGGFVLGAFLSREASARGGAGSAVLGPDGRCLGMVSDVDAARGAPAAVAVRGCDVLRPVVAAIVAEGRVDPYDLGVRLRVGDPAAGEPTAFVDLLRMRAEGKEKGGASVADVAPKGPASGKVWTGDVALALEGRPLVSEVPESFLLAGLALRAGAPADLVLWRGRTRTTLSMTPVRASAIYPDVERELEARGSTTPR